MKRTLPFVIALLALAAPALAVPDGYIDPRWDKDVVKGVSKLKVGMDELAATNIFATIEPKKLLDTLDFKTKIVQEFAVGPNKDRLYLLAVFYQLGTKQTDHKAILAFEAPFNEYRGAKAKLIKFGLADHFTYNMFEKVPHVPVKSKDEALKQLRFKI